MVKKVLIATDGSSSARKAVEVGSETAAKDGAEVVLVHVLLRDHLSDNLRHMAEVEYEGAEGGKMLRDAVAAIPDARFPETELIPESAQTPDRILRAVADKVLDDAERIAREHGVSKITKEIANGNPADRILEVAEDTKVDLIVTGARGLSGVGSLMLGSVSHKLNNLSKVTCVTVR